AVAHVIERLLSPHLAKLSRPEPLVYTVAQAADVLQVSPDTVSRLMARGVLDRVPYVEGKTLIPRTSVHALVTSSRRRTSGEHSVDRSGGRAPGAHPKSE